MSHIPLVAIERTECFSVERADKMITQIIKSEEHMEEHGYVSDVHSVKRHGTVVVTMRYDTASLLEVGKLHALEAQVKEAMNLMVGRRVLPPRENTEEPSGLLHGITHDDIPF